MEILFEDDYILAVNKPAGEIVQPDKAGETALSDAVMEYLSGKNKEDAPYTGVIHRLDRPASGIVLFAKSAPALEKFNEIFRTHSIKKTYWAVVDNKPLKQKGTLSHYLLKDEKQNKSTALDKPKDDAKLSTLSYSLVASSDRYFLLEIDLQTGRHHQIRCQLLRIGCHIKGDLKYGAARSNKEGGIHLHAGKVKFIHPFTKEKIEIIAPPPPEDSLWTFFKKYII